MQSGNGSLPCNDEDLAGKFKLNYSVALSVNEGNISSHGHTPEEEERTEQIGRLVEIISRFVTDDYNVAMSISPCLKAFFVAGALHLKAGGKTQEQSFIITCKDRSEFSHLRSTEKESDGCAGRKGSLQAKGLHCLLLLFLLLLLPRRQN